MNNKRTFTKNKKKSRAPFFVIVFAVILISAVVIKIAIDKKNSFELNEVNSFEINSSVMASELISVSSREKISSADYLLPLDSVGKKSAKIQISGKDYDIPYFCVDTTPPLISLKSESVSVYEGETLDLKEMITSFSDNSGTVSTPEIIGNFDSSKIGTYSVKFTVRDGSGNVSDAILSVEVKESPQYWKVENGKYSLIDGTYVTKSGKILVIKDSIAYVKESKDAKDSFIIANKSFPVPESFAPGFVKEASNAFEEMFDAAKKVGISIPKRTAFRSYSFQNSLYTNYVKNDGKAAADTYSARPGFSEHQTGYCLDMVSVDSDMNAKFKAEYDWLSQNASKFGYILRYPDGKQGITGYIYEPWHYRYVGKELAEKLYNNGNWITMEEYFGVDSSYKY